MEVTPAFATLSISLLATTGTAFFAWKNLQQKAGENDFILLRETVAQRHALFEQKIAQLQAEILVVRLKAEQCERERDLLNLEIQRWNQERIHLLRQLVNTRPARGSGQSDEPPEIS